MSQDPLTHKIIGCAIEVHKELGPGLLESIYQQCLAYELQSQQLRFQSEHPLPVVYKGHALNTNYRIDFIVEQQVIIELKAVDSINPIHKAQLLTYMKLTGVSKGLLINFNSAILKNGIYRFVL
ncbi:MAG: GxxExxY protein [Hydrogenovibrio sp.]